MNYDDVQIFVKINFKKLMVCVVRVNQNKIKSTQKLNWKLLAVLKIII